MLHQRLRQAAQELAAAEQVKVIKPMKIKLFVLRLALIILIGSSAAKLIAADASLVERAKKEGTFILYSSMNQPDVNHLFDGFRKTISVHHAKSLIPPEAPLCSKGSLPRLGPENSSPTLSKATLLPSICWPSEATRNRTFLPKRKPTPIPSAIRPTVGSPFICN